LVFFPLLPASALPPFLLLFSKGLGILRFEGQNCEEEDDDEVPEDEDEEEEGEVEQEMSRAA
jgi:hypothetical protein